MMKLCCLKLRIIALILLIIVIFISTRYTQNYFFSSTWGVNTNGILCTIENPSNTNSLDSLDGNKTAENEKDPCTDIFNSNCSLSMDDPKLVEAVRNMLRPPSTSRTSFKTKTYLRYGYNPSAGQVQLIENTLKSFGKDGFFIECGAADGEWYSNTIWLERTLGWKGLLIEADPPAYEKLIGKNRNAWTGNFCLSSATTPKKLKFYRNGGVMGSLNFMQKEHSKLSPAQVPCLPLYTVLLAINRTMVDFFSLDVEGSELDVLKTVPFDKVLFKILTIEHILIPEGKTALNSFMESKGYVFYKDFTHSRGLAGDSIYFHSSIPIPSGK